MGFTEEIEKEAKYLISEQDYQKFMQLIDNKNIVTQTNYYFDFADNRLGLNNEHGTTIRIREKNDTYELTVKTHDSVLNNNFSSTEHNQIINKEKFYEYLKFGIPYEILPLPQQKDKSLRLGNIGSMITDRSKLFFSNGDVLLLDKNQYLGVVDYEIEFEYHYEYQLKVLIDTIKEKEIQVIPSESKLRRFLKKLNNK